MNLRPDIDQLVELAQKGDTQAFGEIYDELMKPVYRYIFYRVEREIAEDLTEETFLKVWQNLKKYKKGKQPFSAWVFRIAHNLVVDHYRTHKSFDEIDEQHPEERQDNDPRVQTDTRLTNVRLHHLIRRLPENYREIIVLKYINELENHEIAQVTGKSEGSIRTLQSRALEKLRAMLDKDF